MSAQPEPQPRPILGDRFADAAAHAIGLHAHQARKSSAIPYVTHLFAVCSLVLEDAGDEDQAIAALLHDGPEDQGGQVVLDEIRRRFGDTVAELVDGLSDALPAKGEEKQPWRLRKEAYLARLRDESLSVLRVSLADKLHNARSVAVDHERSGEAIWKRFNAERPEQEWYYRELLAIFERSLPDSRNLPELRRIVHDLFGKDDADAAA